MPADKTDIITTVGRRLRQARLEKKLTQEQLGKMIGYSEETIANYERGRRHISLADLNKIAQVLDKPLSFFITDPDAVQTAAWSLKDILARSIEEFLPVRAIPLFGEPNKCLILPREFEGDAALRLEDESLIEFGIGPDSILVFSTHLQPEPGSLVIALHDDVAFPSWFTQGNKRWYKTHSTMDKTGGSAKSEDRIIGVVTWVIHRPNRRHIMDRPERAPDIESHLHPGRIAAEGKPKYEGT